MKTGIGYLCCALVFAVCCGGPAAARDKVRVGHAMVIDFAAMYVAKDKGIFEKHNIDVTLQPLHNSGNNPAAVASNSVQIGSMSPPQLVLANEGGLSLKFIAGGSHTAPNYHLAGVVVRTNLNVSSAKDLEGKKVAVVGINAFLHLLLIDWMEKNGADPKKVNFVELPFAQLPEALRSGSVDAITSVDPFLSRTINSGAGKLLAYYTDHLPEGITPAGLAVTGAFAARNPTLIKNFRTALEEGLAYYLASSDESKAIIPRYLPLPPEILAAIHRPPLRLKIDNSQMSFWLDLMKRQKLLAKASSDPASYIIPWQ